MKKVGCLIVTTAVLLVAALPAHAQRSGFGFSGGGVRGGGVRGGGSAAVGGSAGVGVPAQSSAGFAFRGRSGFHGGHGHSHSNVFVGFGVAAPVWWWGWPYYYPYYYPYPYPYYPYPYPATGYVEQSSVYVQQEQQAEPYYWYYCEGAQAYYPYVQQCPNGWMKVVPTPANGPKASGPKPN
jgi:hypothetical protein